jgi:SAM-dependent methyltransferase
MTKGINTLLPDTDLYQTPAVKIYDRFPSPDFDPVIRFIKKYKPRPGRSFDVGCGTGTLIEKLRDEGWIALGCDPSKDMVQRASQKINPQSISISDATNFDVKIKVDLVTSTFDVLNHLSSLIEVKKFFMRAYDKLDCNGILIFDTVTPNDIKYNWPRYIHVENLGDTQIIIRGLKMKARVGRLYYDFFTKENSGLYSKHSEIHTLRALPLNWTLNCLRSIGYKNIVYVDAMNLNKPSDKTVRWIFSAKKPSFLPEKSKKAGKNNKAISR